MPGVFVPIAFFILFAYVIKVLSDNRIRRLLIEKGQIDENTKYLYADRLEMYVPTSLKWGFVLTGIGLAVLIGGKFDDEVTIALMFLFGGVALILYYLIARRMTKKSEDAAQKPSLT